MKIDYTQPDFYRFNEDSTKLVHFIKNQINFNPNSILDLGAGCGVIGLELAQLFSPEELVLVEGQKAFLPYLIQNKEQFYSQSSVVHSIFSEFSSPLKFDLIVSNPPYFMKGDGRESPLPEKQMCRTWEMDSLEILLNKILSLLAPNGEAWLSLRNDKKIIDILNQFIGIKIFSQTESLIYVRLVAA